MTFSKDQKQRAARKGLPLFAFALEDRHLKSKAKFGGAEIFNSIDPGLALPLFHFLTDVVLLKKDVHESYRKHFVEAVKNEEVVT